MGVFLSWFILVFFLNLWFNILKMNDTKRTPFYADAKAEFGEVVEDTFTFGPFEVTVHPATNEENEWVEVEDCE